MQPSIGVQDVVFVTLVFPGGQLGHLHLSWHDPQRTREITVVGSRKMAVFDDANPTEKLCIFDMGVDFPSGEGRPLLRNDGAEVVQIALDEPLALVCQHFLDSIDRGHALLSTGWAGVEVVRILEAAQASLEAGGSPVSLSGSLAHG